METFRK